jgi:acyl-CoA thioesterase-1
LPVKFLEGFIKKLMPRLGIVLILIISLYGAGCDNGSTNNYRGTTLVCLGDSLTAGYGATVPGKDDTSKSYPAYLQNKINIPVINAGASGDTTSQGLSRVISDVLSQNPWIVIIELGANDIFKGISAQTTKNNLQKIIGMVDNGNRKIYLAKFYTESVARSMAEYHGISDYDMQTLLINLYDDMFRALASSNNVEIIDAIWDGVWGEHMSDEVHPNAEGYAIMADNYFKALQPYLEEHNLIKGPAESAGY